jgi:uncharacterized protein (DUF1330 family)
MAAYLVGQITVKDPELWKEYTSRVPATFVPYGAEIVFRGRRASSLAGELDLDLVAVVRFPDHEALLAWHGSSAYQALIPTRDAAADTVVMGYKEVG